MTNQSSRSKFFIRFVAIISHDNDKPQSIRKIETASVVVAHHSILERHEPYPLKSSAHANNDFVASNNSKASNSPSLSISTIQIALDNTMPFSETELKQAIQKVRMRLIIDSTPLPHHPNPTNKTPSRAGYHRRQNDVDRHASLQHGPQTMSAATSSRHRLAARPRRRNGFSFAV